MNWCVTGLELFEPLKRTLQILPPSNLSLHYIRVDESIGERSPANSPLNSAQLSTKIVRLTFPDALLARSYLLIDKIKSG